MLVLRRLAWASGLLSAVAIGCGSNVEVGGGGGQAGGPTGSSSSSSSGTAGGLPDECQVDTSQPTPHEVVFRFENATDQPLFLRRICTLDLAVSACADDYGEPLALWPGLSADCNDPSGGCVQSEACLTEAVAAEAGVPVNEPWPGKVYTFDINAEGCVCHYEHHTAAAKYRVTVPVFGSVDVEDEEPAFEVEVNFEVPAPAGIVAVPLSP